MPWIRQRLLAVAEPTQHAPGWQAPNAARHKISSQTFNPLSGMDFLIDIGPWKQVLSRPNQGKIACWR
jgi:ureidoglycolate hydrolase